MYVYILIRTDDVIWQNTLCSGAHFVFFNKNNCCHVLMIPCSQKIDEAK